MIAYYLDVLQLIHQLNWSKTLANVETQNKRNHFFWGEKMKKSVVFQTPMVKSILANKAQEAAADFN